MKKFGTAGIVFAMMFTLAMPALAAGTLGVAPSSSPIALPISAPAPSSGYPITVDGTPIAAQAVVLVPLRAVGEALGFTVTWDKAVGGARLDNGSVHTEVVPGRDLFVVTSSTAIGMTAPFSLGGAPVMLSGALYVPVGLFQPLLGNRADTIDVTGGTISITSDTLVQMPNPATTYGTVEALEKALGFAVPLPTVAEGYTVKALRGIGGTLAEVQFVKGAQSITYRVNRGSTDNSGDYSKYSLASTLAVGEVSVECRGDGKTVQVASWVKGEFAYSLQSKNGLSGIEAMVKSAV